MDNRLYWDPEKELFVIRSESESAQSEMLVVNHLNVHLDGPISPDYIDPDKLIGLIIKYNHDIQQGFINDYPIEYDEASLRDAIEKYNDIVEYKYLYNLKNRNK